MTDWQRCIRAVMACMIKHSGLLFEFLQATRKHENCFSEGENGADGPSLYDKFRMVSVSAQSLQVGYVVLFALWKALSSAIAGLDASPGPSNSSLAHLSGRPPSTNSYPT